MQDKSLEGHVALLWSIIHAGIYDENDLASLILTGEEVRRLYGMAPLSEVDDKVENALEIYSRKLQDHGDLMTSLAQRLPYETKSADRLEGNVRDEKINDIRVITTTLLTNGYLTPMDGREMVHQLAALEAWKPYNKEDNTRPTYEELESHLRDLQQQKEQRKEQDEDQAKNERHMMEERIKTENESLAALGLGKIQLIKILREKLSISLRGAKLLAEAICTDPDNILKLYNRLTVEPSEKKVPIPGTETYAEIRNGEVINLWKRVSNI